MEAGWSFWGKWLAGARGEGGGRVVAAAKGKRQVKRRRGRYKVAREGGH